MVDASPLGSRAPLGPPGTLRAFLEQNHFLLVFALLASVMGVSVGMAQVTNSLHAVELGSSASMLGLIAASQSIGVIFMSLPVGLLSDRLGPHRPFIFGTALVGVVYALIPLAPAPAYLLLGTALISFFMPFRFVSLNTVFLQQLAHLGDTKAGWYRGTHMVGMFLIGPVLGASVVSAFGSAASYYLVAVAFGATILLSPIVFARYSPQPSRSHRGEGAARVSSWRTLRAQVASLVRDPELRRVSVVEATTQATGAFFTFFIPVVGLRLAGMSERAASSLISAKGIGYIFALFFLGGVLGRIGPVRGYAASFAVIAAGLLALGSTAQPLLLWLGSVVVGLGLGAVQISTLTRYAQIGLRTGYGKVSGFNALVGPVGWVLGGLLGGNAAEWLGLQAVFLLAAAGFTLAGGWLLLRPAPQRVAPTEALQVDAHGAGQ